MILNRFMALSRISLSPPLCFLSLTIFSFPPFYVNGLLLLVFLLTGWRRRGRLSFGQDTQIVLPVSIRFPSPSEKESLIATSCNHIDRYIFILIIIQIINSKQNVKENFINTAVPLSTQWMDYVLLLPALLPPLSLWILFKTTHRQRTTKTTIFSTPSPSLTL